MTTTTFPSDGLRRSFRLGQAIRLVVYGHDEATHEIVPTLTRDEITHDDERAVARYISKRAAEDLSDRELGCLDLGGEHG